MARGEEEEDWDPALEVLCVAVGVVAAEGVDTPRERVLTAEEEGEDKMEAVLCAVAEGRGVGVGAGLWEGVYDLCADCVGRDVPLLPPLPIPTPIGLPVLESEDQGGVEEGEAVCSSEVV